MTEPLDMALLVKLARGTGGRRTGALRRARLLEWRITPEGRLAIRRYADGLHFAGRLAEERRVREVLARLEEEEEAR